jgi:hypothetical protein
MRTSTLRRRARLLLLFRAAAPTIVEPDKERTLGFPARKTAPAVAA